MTAPGPGQTGGSYVFGVFRGRVRHTVILWNGVRDYSRPPSPENMATVNMGQYAATPAGKVAMVQVRKPRPDNRKIISTMLDAGFDTVILWTRDTKTYETMRDDFKRRTTLTAEGGPRPSRH